MPQREVRCATEARFRNHLKKAQRALLADVDAGKISMDDLFAHADRLLKERLPATAAHKPPEPKSPLPASPAVAAAAPATVAH